MDIVWDFNGFFFWWGWWGGWVGVGRIDKEVESLYIEWLLLWWGGDVMGLYGKVLL